MLNKTQLKQLDKYDWTLERRGRGNKNYYYFFVFEEDVPDLIKAIEAKTLQEMADKIKVWIKTL